mgnify:CR=1 FL=1
MGTATFGDPRAALRVLDDLRVTLWTRGIAAVRDITDPLDGYGSMQVHNPSASQTLFAINHWREGGNGDYNTVHDADST